MIIRSINGVVFDNADISTLYATTFVNGNESALYPLVLQRHHEMRIDLVSKDMYGDVDHVDTVMDINGLVNPFAIKEGDILFYCDDANVQAFLADREQLNALREALIDRSKRSKADPARLDYKRRAAQIEKDKRSPLPTVRKPGVEQSSFDNGYILLNPNF